MPCLAVGQCCCSWVNSSLNSKLFLLIHLLFCALIPSAGIVRMEQKNNTLLEMGVYDDGPYEVGDEHVLSPDLVPLPANSYLGECQLTQQMNLWNEFCASLLS